MKSKRCLLFYARKEGKKAPQLQQGKAAVRWKNASELTFAYKAGREVKSCSPCNTQVCGKLAKAKSQTEICQPQPGSSSLWVKNTTRGEAARQREPYPCYVTCAGLGLRPRVPPGARCWVTGTTARRGLPETESQRTTTPSAAPASEHRFY